MTLTGNRQPCGRLHRRDHDGGAGHVAFHVFHRRARFQAQAARVERHPLADQGKRGCVAPVPVIEDDETRRLVRARGHAEQAAESLVADPRLVPDLDGEPGVAGDHADAICELSRRLFRGRSVDQVTSQVDGMADDLAATQALLELDDRFLGLVVATTRLSVFKGMSTSFALPHSGPAGAGDGPLDQRRRD